LYPPTLLLESLAQVGGIVLGSKAREENPQGQFIGLFAGVSDFKFLRYPNLGEQITLKVEVTQSVASLYRFAAEAFISGEKIAGGQILLSFIQNPSGKAEPSPAEKK
jgi:3-hydroxymyristoyl/3-hydroxydecanoyl-(acyl carrier protein) dehydratase